MCISMENIKDVYFSFTKNVLNEAELLLILSYSLIAAIIVFRLPWTWRCSKQLMKFIHAGLHMLTFVLTVISMVAVFDFHNAAKIPNMYSLHSWLGLTALILYTLQIFLGVALYLMPFAPVSWRAAFMPFHIYTGLFIFTSVIAVALMGITEKLIFGLSMPKYKDSPPEATFVNILGVLLVVFGSFILFIVTQKSWKRPSDQTLHNPLTIRGGGPGLSQLSEEIGSETSSDVRKRNSKLEDQAD